MANKAQISTQIRFAMEQLSERNAHHEWEHLCRHLVRERICSNILPATGPVQSGGDQGRDFETFHTSLAPSPLRQGSFVGLISDKPLVFACTLEKAVESKMRCDVTTIMSSGTPVEGIYVLTTRGVPVPKRHKLQEWARAAFAVSLEILDGAAIAEMLSDHDTYWIAEQYLQLPAELRPAAPSAADGKDWYGRTLDKWRRETRPPQTFADFGEIRAAARIAQGPFAYDDDGHPVSHFDRPELPFWIERLDDMADQAVMDGLRRRALYEASVLRLRCLGSLIGQESRLRQYFASIPQLTNVADVEDAEVLLTFVLGASRLGHMALAHDEVETWLQALEHRLGECLHEAKRNERLNEQCALLETSGHMALFHSLRNQSTDVTETFRCWSKLAKLATSAPLFPLERFADRLAQYARYIGSHPDYEQLTQTVDALLVERFGHFKAAEKCLQRAEAFQEAGDLSRAMSQLHKAKIDWFAEETLGKSLLALRWLSGIYAAQNMFFAAKYYALGAAYAALHAQDLQVKPLIARSLEQAASCDYALGAWYGFLDLAETSARFYPHFAHDMDKDFNDPNGVLLHLMFHLGLLPVITRALHPSLEAFARERCVRVAKTLGMDDVFNDMQREGEKVWLGKEPEALWDKLEEQVAGPPWSDAGPIRRAQWTAHGVTWSAQWTNDYETTLVVEGFLAALQILLSDLAGCDLCLMRSTLDIWLRVVQKSVSIDSRDITGYAGFETHFEPSNTQQRAIVMLPPYRHFQDGTLSVADLQAGALGVAASLLTHVSLSPTEGFDVLLKERFEQGLMDKLFVAAPFANCFSQFVDQRAFDASARAMWPPLVPHRPFLSRLPESMPWFDGPGPGYDQEIANTHISNRYAQFLIPIRRTLARLVHEPGFQATVARLRADGWKDWHILSAVFHVTMNYRLNQRRILAPTPNTETAAIQQFASQPEPEDAPIVPLSEYEEKKLRQRFSVYASAFAKNYGLQIHQLTPDLAAIEDFLTCRYNFWTDDADHDDPFSVE